MILVIRAFNDTSVERWESNQCDNCDHYFHSDGDDSDERERSSGGWQHVESSVAVFSIMHTHDKKMLAHLRKNASTG